MDHKKICKLRTGESRIYFLTLLSFLIFHFSCYAQVVCSEFTITGTTPDFYVTSQGSSCTISPIPVGQIYWTNTPINGIPNGFIKHTFNNPQTNVSIWYTIVNDDDFGTIDVNGSGVVSLSLVSGCANLSGNILGPYTGSGFYGDILVNIQSTAPFTEVTIVNTGGSSGQVSGDCNSVIIHSNSPCSIDLGKDTTLCKNETLTLIATTANATYLWQDNSINPTFNVIEQGTYWVEVTVDSCSSTDTIVVDYIPLPIINLDNYTSICQGETLTLDVSTSNASYLWQDNSKNPFFNVTEPGTYWVEVTVNGCSSKSIILVDEYCETILEIPNVFTPNNDGVNDLFVPLISKGIVSMNTVIVNRWGNKIFENNKLLIEWDGKDVSDGTYFWIINYTDMNGVKSSLTGYVTILK